MLLRRSRDQFLPFHGVFGCDILARDWRPFPATLFRFPFRTEHQAKQSLILQKDFSSDKRQAFISDLAYRGGNLMLFLQHVRTVELYDLPHGVADPARARRLALIERKSECHVRLQASHASGGTLDQFSALWREAVETGTALQDHEMVETVTVSMEGCSADTDRPSQPEGNTGPVPMEHRSSHEDQPDSSVHGKRECMFRVAWATGQGESCDIARETCDEGFIPIAAVGIPVNGQDQVVAMETLPEGTSRMREREREMLVFVSYAVY